jgi:hypothetical protein
MPRPPGEWGDSMVWGSEWGFGPEGVETGGGARTEPLWQLRCRRLLANETFMFRNQRPVGIGRCRAFGLGGLRFTVPSAPASAPPQGPTQASPSATPATRPRRPAPGPRQASQTRSLGTHGSLCCDSLAAQDLHLGSGMGCATGNRSRFPPAASWQEARSTGSELAQVAPAPGSPFPGVGRSPRPAPADRRSRFPWIGHLP